MAEQSAGQQPRPPQPRAASATAVRRNPPTRKAQRVRNRRPATRCSAMQRACLTPERNGLTARNGRTDPRPTTLKRPTPSAQRRPGTKPVARRRPASNRRRNAILRVNCWTHLRCPTDGCRRSTGQPPRRSRMSCVRAAIQPATTTQCSAINSPTLSKIPRRLCARLSRCPRNYASKWWTARGQRRASKTSACRR